MFLSTSLDQIYTSRISNLPSTTLSILRQSLAIDHDLTWTDQEWKKGGVREQVRKEWDECLRRNRRIELDDEDEKPIATCSSSPVIIVESKQHPSSKPSSRRKSDPSKTTKGKGKGKEVVTVDDEDEVLDLVDSDRYEEGEESKKKENKGKGKEILDIQEPDRKIIKKKKKKESTTSTKYDRAASKNLSNFMGMVGGALVDALGIDDDDCDEDDGEGGSMILDEEESNLNLYEGSELDSEDTREEDLLEVQKKKQKGKRKSSTLTEQDTDDKKDIDDKKEKTKTKRKRRQSSNSSKSTAFKSTEFVQDSDDSSHSINGEEKGKERVLKKKKKRKSVVEDDEEEEGESGEEVKEKKKKSTTFASGSTSRKKTADTKGKKKESKPTVQRKEGDADLGSEAEEERIRKMKKLLSLAGTSRPFTASTGSERSLSATCRIEILENLLITFELLKKRGGKLPGESRAREMGELRALEKEKMELEGSTVHEGLRTGKVLRRPGDDHDGDLDDISTREDDEKSGVESPRKKKQKVETERKKFASFLGDQSESE